MILEYLFAFGVMVVMVVFFATMLYFCKYKKKSKSGCSCGAGHCGANGGSRTGAGCYDEKSRFVEKYAKMRAQENSTCGCGNH